VESYPPHWHQRRSTNGLAIASFVLSLVWVAGLGSLLAVILGIAAHSSIKRSQGSQSGSGFATAGIVIGIIGLLGAALLFASVAAVDHELKQAVTPKVFALGTTVNVSAADNSGIRTVTVSSVDYPVDSDGRPDPTVGKEYAAASVQVCAGPSGSQNGPNDILFDLLFPDGDTVYSDPLDSTKQPSLSSFQGIGANECVSGYLTFEIAQGTTPDRIRYWPDPFHNYQWRLLQLSPG
jgi:hypothetical protein